jgi:hypothetical protein
MSSFGVIGPSKPAKSHIHAKPDPVLGLAGVPGWQRVLQCWVRLANNRMVVMCELIDEQPRGRRGGTKTRSG